jgi:SNF2 family DNA or RNA helicase
VIVPNAVVPNWRNEIKRWLPAATTCVYRAEGY